MAKRGYKLQEFVAHSANVNCIKIGKKTRRHFITGGDDEIVNVWSIGKAAPITSLSGHTSPIESVTFDSTEVLVAAGASSGVVKLWELEETKVFRTLNGHRSYCTSLEFHPFGEFLASGSMDTNLKIWDIRKKGCIHTYKGHKRAISTIRFTPDGRWVVSGGLDNVVKIWDLTAGKLLHEFKLHEGHIKSMDFHPIEFLLATGSSDRTVKFWDLETFELIGTTRPEATGVRSVTFHPDGRTLFCGLDNSLKVYSWEPIICHDAVDIGWSTLGDLCIDDGKLLGCSYYQNSIGVWATDVSHIEPYAHNMIAMEKAHVEPKTDLQESVIERVKTPRMSFIPSDDDTKDIKNIYVDTAGMTPVVSRKDGSNTNIQRRLFTDDVAIDSDSSEEKTHNSTSVSEECQKSSSNHEVSIDSSNKRLTPVKCVAVSNGKTRNLVEKFEKKESQKPNTDNMYVNGDTVEQPPVNVVTCAIPETATSPIKTPDNDMASLSVSEAKLSPVTFKASPKAKVLSVQRRPVASKRVISEKVRSPPMAVAQRCRASSQVIPERSRIRTRTSPLPAVPRQITSTHMTTEKPKFSPLFEDNPQTTGRGLMCKNDDTEDLMIDHELFLSTLQSRLTKLQVIGHFWAQNDTRGAINALQKLPDHAVHADVISVMLENTECLNLDHFSCLLPLLLGLLDSNTERHINVSLEMLLKLVAVFGPLITSTISTPPSVGVDLHAEKRFECCNECHVELQKIQKSLPNVIRRGGLTARSAQELNLVLQLS
ncbi:katanin p80 WD40 repeat-containing subunit B1 homolog KTN80.3 isoform X1 [Lactuca sativa]|uniref:katanin p80 WD40 repeat-containing subunit B1 homolog KTN80.3 isoform X1 n=1 Tax=Lactuca sativa TaxID=4236 RepID=UPI000CADF289|nr:katanin p80 WD40 repeat-containing subunit B1 homolog KTN80.3 isoform X1 [Lactuca sativa]